MDLFISISHSFTLTMEYSDWPSSTMECFDWLSPTMECFDWLSHTTESFDWPKSFGLYFFVIMCSSSTMLGNDAHQARARRTAASSRFGGVGIYHVSIGGGKGGRWGEEEGGGLGSARQSKQQRFNINNLVFVCCLVLSRPNRID